MQRGRKPNFFYVEGDVWDAIWLECQSMQLSPGPLADYSGHLLLFGLPVIPFDLPEGFILASEQELH